MIVTFVIMLVCDCLTGGRSYGFRYMEKGMESSSMTKGTERKPRMAMIILTERFFSIDFISKVDAAGLN